VWDFPFDRILSFVDYDDTVQAVMHQIKYQGKKSLACYMGTICAPFFRQFDTLAYDVVIPIPLHWMRMHKRGYNQAEWFARGLFGDYNRPCIDCSILRRSHRTRTQTLLDRSDRRRNVADAFELTKGGAAAIRGKKVLLVDDVITTGATTAAAATTLLATGCAMVTVVSFARD
jgi:ComF family protein